MHYVSSVLPKLKMLNQVRLGHVGLWVNWVAREGMGIEGQ